MTHIRTHLELSVPPPPTKDYLLFVLSYRSCVGISGPMGEERRKLHNEELHNLNALHILGG
jgi:hypothetical protein